MQINLRPSVQEGCGPEAASQQPCCEPGTETSAFTLLLVEDDLMSAEMLCLRLEGLFRQVIVAYDGDQGYELFCEHQPDIVLTDQIMPGLSGLDLMRKIRATGAKTPVVLMTSTIDNKLLLEAINSGVERFVPKPFNFDLLMRTLNSIAREMVNARLMEQRREQEVDLLRYRDAYHSMQQESALSKERHVVRNDLRNRVLEGAGGVRWGINVVYSPRDIMCGDGYSVRRLFDGRLLVYLGDAMGSGVSASLTAMLTTSFCNYQIENLHLWKDFTLRIFLSRFQEYLSSVLLEEEVLSCGFLLVDLQREEIESALFALPPLLARSLDGSVRTIRGANPPLGIYPYEVKIGTFSLSNVSDLLIMTDGVTDAELLDNASYREVIENDFRAAPTIAALVRRFAQRTAQDTLDDLTLMHLGRLDFDAAWKWTGEPGLTLAGLGRTIAEFLDALAREVRLDPAARDELEVMLTEAMTNALEHGCLNIDREEKSRMLLEGDYDEALGSRVPRPDARMALSATLSRGAGNPLLVMEVRDNGSGLPAGALDAHADKTGVNGRGLQMINRLSEALFSDGPGGCLIMVKTLEKGEADED